MQNRLETDIPYLTIVFNNRANITCLLSAGKPFQRCGHHILSFYCIELGKPAYSGTG